jgi:hypothetical protein
MNEPLLGKPITGDAGRDAIHIAIVPAVAAERLAPGTRVGIAGPEKKATASAEKLVGIVDPYLRGPVFEGERFWLFLDPRTITSLRHVWEHPDFPAEGQEATGSLKAASEKWIRNYAASLDLTYRQIMDGAEEWTRRGEYLCGGSNLEGEQTSPEFWQHYEIVTGKKVDTDNRDNFFTCSC